MRKYERLAIDRYVDDIRENHAAIRRALSNPKFIEQARNHKVDVIEGILYNNDKSLTKIEHLTK